MKTTLNKFLTINKFLDVFKIPRGYLLFILMLMMISGAAQAASAGLLIPFLNSFQNIDSSVGGNRVVNFISNFFTNVDSQQRYIYVLFSMLLIMSFVQLLTIFISRLILHFTFVSVENKSANILYDEILNARMKFFYKQKSGSLINHLTHNIKYSNICLQYLLEMVSPIIITLSFLAIGAMILPVYTLILVISIIIFVLIFKGVAPYLYSLGKSNVYSAEFIKNLIASTLQGMRSIILSSAQEQQNKKFQELTGNYYTTLFKSTWIAQCFPYFVKFLCFLVVGSILFINRNKIVNAHPEYLSEVLFFVYVSGSIFMNVGKLHSLHSGYAFAYESLDALLLLEKELRSSKAETLKGVKKLNSFNDQIQITNLDFEYIKDEKVIDSITLDIKRNRKIAFVGQSGSGKSTLIDIISGFHDDYKGSILIDGIELKDIDKNEWRHLLGYVSQESFIFNDTIRNNLTFGFKESIDDEQIIDACKKAQVYETIMGFKDQFNTELGERGIRLSGGEKQRLSIARLFLKNPSVILLDEATSSLDSESEKKVKEGLANLSQGRTVIAIAHRLSTIADFDEIHVLDKGKILESGTHSQLIESKKEYYKYFTIQSLESSFVGVAKNV